MEQKKTGSLFLRSFLILSLFLSLSACQGLPFNIDLSKFFAINEPTGSQTPSEMPVATETPDLQTDPTLAPLPDNLIVWLPPEMDPNGDDPAAELLKAQLDAFSQENGISITVRIKDRSGVGGLLDALTATSVAAPDVLPDLIALPRKDLENAALKSLVFPLDDQTTTIDDIDWYPYAKELALIQGSIFGFPFMGDALGVVYRSDSVDKTPNTWAALFADTDKVAFALDDPKANFILTLYQAVGGLVQDNQRKPMIDGESLVETLTFLKDNVDTYAYRELVLQLQNETQVWQAYQNGLAEAAVISISVYLQNKPESSAMMALPPVNDLSLTTGSGWVWAIATPLAERQALGIKLAEKLVESDFLAGWNSAYGGMPPRPSSLEQWQDLGERSLISQISLMAILHPSNDIISSLAPLFRDAGIQVVRDQIDPQTATQTAIESLK